MRVTIDIDATEGEELSWDSEVGDVITVSQRDDHTCFPAGEFFRAVEEMRKFLKVEVGG